MEVELLKKRFSESRPVVANSGKITHEFFCARQRDARLYEGRIFVTEKVLFFVSTYSDALEFDMMITMDDICQVVLLQRLVPGIELIMKDSTKEVFTNFHDFKKVTAALKGVLPASIPFEVRKQALFTRLVSMPAHYQDRAQVCPYFSASNFCPRREFCKLRHISQSESAVAMETTPIDPTSKSVPTSPVKQLAVSEEGPPSPVEAHQPTMKRSVSSPSHGYMHNMQHSVPQKQSEQGNNHEDQKKLPLSERGKGDKGHVVTTDGVSPASPQPCGGFEQKQIANMEASSIPSTFVFSSEQQATDNGVFVFSAGDSTDRRVLGKRKNACLFNIGRRRDGGRSAREETRGAKRPPGGEELEESELEESDLERMAGLAVDDDDISFSPEEFDIEYQRIMLQAYKEKSLGDLPTSPSCEYQSLSSSDDEGYGVVPHVTMPSQLAVYPAHFIKRDDISSGDKIILPADILVACEQRRISYPMAFKFENRALGRMVHAGVLEFTSPTSDAAYLPQWMFDHLGTTTVGEKVYFEHVELPKGQFVQLQPVSSAWLGVPYDKRMAIMEFQLRNFQTLTEGTKVSLTYELNRYTFKVLLCKPAKGISIIDADLTTDIVEPADFNRFHSVEEWQAEHIPLDEPVQCSLSAGTYRHFVVLSLPGQNLPAALKVEVKCEEGDPDLFLCQVCSTPSQTRYTWVQQDIGDSVILLSTDDKDYDVKKSLFAGVVSLSEDTKFTICFHTDSSDSATSMGHVLRSSTSGSGPTVCSGTDESEKNSISLEDLEKSNPVPPGHERCLYCGIIMPQLRMVMHERHCAQSTYKCPLCKGCFHKSFEKKHHLITHELLQCECGKELTQHELHRHQLTDCQKRTVKCQFKWCNLSFPQDQLQAHESMCGRKQVLCPVCSQDVSQLELEMHLEAFHDVDVINIDRSKPLSSQITYKACVPVSQNFTCHCGAGFQYEDDLQVHQLTACTPGHVIETPGRVIETDEAEDIN